MNENTLSELIRSGENSGVEFKRDLTRPERLGREIAALLNLEGGYILLGVDDDGSVSGLSPASLRGLEEWVMQVARDHVQPSMIPYWQTVAMDSGAVVGVVSIPSDAPDKPYKARRGSAWVTQARVGTTTRDATREEEERLYQASGRVRYGMKPAPGATLDNLDRRRLNDYFTRVLEGDAPPDDDAEQWQRLLYNLELATSAAGRATATVDGMLLFGYHVSRFLPQSGIRAICYPGEEPDYAARADEALKGPMTPLRAREGYHGGVRAGGPSVGFRPPQHYAIGVSGRDAACGSLGVPGVGRPRSGGQRAGASGLQHRGDGRYAAHLLQSA